MLRGEYDVQFEGTAVRTDQPRFLRESSVPRDQGWSWVILLAAFLTLFITNGVHTSFGILYAALLDHFKSGREETAWIGSISLGLLCFFSPIASVLIEQIGCRATSATGGLLCSLGFLLSSFATGITFLYFTHGVLFGLGTSLTYTAAMTVVTRCFDRKRNIATGLCSSGSQFGGISLAPLSQVLFDRLGYANTFRTFSGLLLVVAISSLAYKPELVENKALDSSSKKSPREMLNIWKNKAYVVWGLATTMVTLGYNIPRYTLVKYAIDLNISKEASAWLISYLCATSAIGRIMFGRLCEWISKLHLCQACVVGCACSAILYPFLKSYLALVIACVIFGLPDGGFVSSLPMVTTEIVGPERIAEGFGFMLFCQSYSNVIGPPLSGMLYDTYHSYEAAFCFAALPEVIGVLMMFLVPYYMRNQVNYRQEIDFNSNSGMLVEGGGDRNTSSNRVTEPRRGHDTAGSYNVVINLVTPVPPSDIRQVNVIIMNASKETTCIENASIRAEVSSTASQRDGEATSEGAEQTQENMQRLSENSRDISSNSTIVASDCVSTAKNENPVHSYPSPSVSQEVITVHTTNPPSQDLGSHTHVKVNIVAASAEVPECPNQTLNTAKQCPSTLIEGCLSQSDQHNTLKNDSDSASQSSQHQNLLDGAILNVPQQSLCDKPESADDSVVNTTIASLISETKASDKSISSGTSSVRNGISSSTAVIPDENNEVCAIINLAEEPPALLLTASPHFIEHNPCTKTETNSELSEQTNEQSHEKPMTPTASGFPSSLEAFVQDNLACSPDLAFAGENAPPVSIRFDSDGSANQNAESLMTSPGLNDVFPLVQDQLPEPLKPTSVSSVRGNAPQAPTNSAEVNPCSNLEKASASSPLSCELSTVIADVIQSLTSQHAAAHKSDKESVCSSIGNATASFSSRADYTPNIDPLEKGKTDSSLEEQSLHRRKNSNISPQAVCNDLSPRSKMQTSVLDSMQSIVAEGWPEDFALLEDISIDLSLDKDPSIASIVLLDDQDIPDQHMTNFNNLDNDHRNLSHNALPSSHHFEQSNFPAVPAVQANFIQEPPNVNVFTESSASQRSAGSSTPTAAMAINPIESTNPFYSSRENQLQQ